MGSTAGINLGIAGEMADVGVNNVLNSFTNYIQAKRIAEEPKAKTLYIQTDMSEVEKSKGLIKNFG